MLTVGIAERLQDLGKKSSSRLCSLRGNKSGRKTKEVTNYTSHY